MSQHDMTIENASGASVRADLNNALQALASLSLGASAPGTTFAGMLWADTTNSLLKMRNSTNAAWNTIGTLDTDYLALRLFPRGYLFGLTLSNNGSDATNDIDIAAGDASSDDTADADRVRMTLASALTKRLDANWAVGTNQGGLDTSSATNTTYHVYLIQRTDTGVVDALFSTSASSPSMPTNYTKKRRIGAILRESAAIVGFVQVGDTFWRKVPISDASDDNPGTSAVTRTLSVPTGITVEAILFGMVYGYASGAARLLLTSPSQTDSVATTGVTTVIQPAANAYGGAMARVSTNTSAQIRSRLNVSDATTYVEIGTHGWVDLRGRMA